MKEVNLSYTITERVSPIIEGFRVIFQFQSGTIMETTDYLCHQLIGLIVCITQLMLGVASIGTGAKRFISFCSKKERNSLQAAPSLVKRFLLLLNEEMEYLTFSEVDFLALAREVTVKTFSFFGLFFTHSSKMVYSGTNRDSRPTTALKPDCWRSQAYSFNSRYSVRLVRTLLLIVNFNAIERDIGTKQGDFADSTKPPIEFI
jgi:hypothetical protein